MKSIAFTLLCFTLGLLSSILPLYGSSPTFTLKCHYNWDTIFPVPKKANIVVKLMRKGDTSPLWEKNYSVKLVGEWEEVFYVNMNLRRDNFPRKLFADDSLVILHDNRMLHTYPATRLVAHNDHFPLSVGYSVLNFNNSNDFNNGVSLGFGGFLHPMSRDELDSTVWHKDHFIAGLNGSLQYFSDDFVQQFYMFRFDLFVGYSVESYSFYTGFSLPAAFIIKERPQFNDTYLLGIKYDITEKYFIKGELFFNSDRFPITRKPVGKSKATPLFSTSFSISIGIDF